MFEGTSLRSHISNFKEIISGLEVMKAKISIQEHLCSLLVMSLHASYSAFRDTVFYGHKDLTL